MKAIHNKTKKSRDDVREHYKKLLAGKDKKIEINNGDIPHINLSYQCIRNITGKPHKYQAAKNYATYRLANIIKNAKYLYATNDRKPNKHGHRNLLKWHYLEFELIGEKSYMVIGEFQGGEFRPHAIQDYEHFKLQK